MTAVATTSALHLGAVVSYHGTHTAEHHATYYVYRVGTRLTIVDVDYPTSGVLSGVHPAHVTPTGVALPLCGCLHDSRLVINGMCGAVGCDCDAHSWDLR